MHARAYKYLTMIHPFIKITRRSHRQHEIFTVRRIADEVLIIYNALDLNIYSGKPDEGTGSSVCPG
jgi:hypothetical protein